MTTKSKTDFECCPPFDPKLWDDKLHNWEQKKFIRDKVRTFLYMPLNFGKVMKRLDEKVRKAETQIPDWLGLSDHTSAWNMDIYLAVDKPVSDAENLVMTGRYYSKVYEGPFRDTKKWCQDFESHALSKGMTTGKQYMWYTTCPKCAKKYGKNYVVILSEVK